MMAPKTPGMEESRLHKLLAMLESDPENLPLLSETADAALAERRPQLAVELLERYSAIERLGPAEINLTGLAALQEKRFEEAAAAFEQLIEGAGGDAALRFNLAWVRALQQEFSGALDLLSDDVTQQLPQAAMLHVQILHELGQFDAAGDRARLYLKRHSEHPGLMAAVSVLALDIDDPELAASCARAAPDHPDALSTLGTLALGDDRPDEALGMFNRALERNEALPRAWVGRGLAELMAGQSDRAAADIDRGAEMFGRHLGSWIAAGWAHFVAGDLVSSRLRFEKAKQLNPNFAESHGSLAVLDAVEGNFEGARSGAERALRLDRQCVSGALAQVLITAARGDEAGAKRIFDLAINAPVDDSGRTIAQSLARLGLART